LERKHTKIVATIGPSSEKAEVLRQMIRAGMNVARINFSHGEHEEHGRRIETIRKVAQEEGAVIAILADIQGPKIRIGTVANEPRTLAKGDTVTLTLDEVAGEGKIFSLPHPEFMQDIKVGTNLLLDDGNIQFAVIDTTPRSLVCEVTVPGELKSRKGVSAPNAKLTLSAITPKDREDIRFALSQNVDYIAMSFVRNADDIRQLRWMMGFFGNDAKIIAKIEMQEALDNLEQIIKETDGVMVARGDLGVETPAERVPFEQKRMIRLCNAAGKPVITATQMLESMRTTPRPTRAEASDVYNAILDGTDAVMLSAESASGTYPVEAVTTMSNIALAAEEFVFANRSVASQNPFSHNTYEGEDGISNAIGAATVAMSEVIQPTAIVTTSITGYTTMRVAKERPRTPIICATPNDATFRRMALVWGVEPLLVSEYNTIDEMISVIIRAAHEQGMVKRGDSVLLLAGVPFGVKGQTNLMKVHVVGENGEI
jgi:pyruvate kinase